MTDTNTNKLENWAFPFKTAGASAEVSDPQLYYDALAKANSGFYPMGANGLWHGGVHFDAGTGALLEQSAVRCIADGEVIAYRIDERYPTSQYGEGPTAVHLPFSTGFVLVKHRLELPALPTAPTATATTATPATSTAANATPTTAGTPASAPVTATPATPAAAPASEVLTFYSLYMHLRDWTGYRACPTPEVPDFIGEKTYSVKPDKAVDAVKGLKVRAGPKPPAGTPASVEYTTELALLPKGCKIKVGDLASATSQWHKLESILQGAALPALSETQGWVYVGELEATPEPNIYLVGAKANDSNTTLAPLKGLNVRSADKASLLGLLPVGAKFKIAPGTGDYRELKEITEGMDIAPLKANSVGNILGYVHWASLQANLIDPPFDKVVPLNPPIPIKAGELIGHLGQYQNHDDATPKTLLHLEVFSCEDVPAFISKSQARAASLPDSAKTLLHVQPGTKLVTHTASMTAANPPTVRDPGNTIGVTRSIPLAVLNSLPAANKIQTSTPMTGGPAVITNWWRLDNAFADAQGNPISGWLADVISTRENPTGTRHSPWEWLGFDFISETTSATEQFANHLAGQCLLSEAELPDYQAHISTADNGPIKTRLYDIIDGADGTVRDEKLSVAEIRAALGKPWHAQSISQLISHYESEWYWQDAKWDELDKLMLHTLATANTDWVAEKVRIKTLAWWDKVEGLHGIKAGGMAWHLHAMSLVGQFISTYTKLITPSVP
jgi:hypothetical protein